MLLTALYIIRLAFSLLNKKLPQLILLPLSILYCRIITYGTINVSRYLIYKHGWRWRSSATAAVSKPVKKLLPVTAGVGLLGVLQWMYVKRRIYPVDGESVRPASNWEVRCDKPWPHILMSGFGGVIIQRALFRQRCRSSRVCQN